MKKIIFKGFIQAQGSKIGKCDGELECSFKTFVSGGEEESLKVNEFLSQLKVQQRAEAKFTIEIEE